MPLSIDSVRALGSPQLSYKWEVVLPTILPKSPSVNSVTSLVSTIRSGEAGFNKIASGFNPSFVVEEIQGLPFPSVSNEPFYEGGKNTYFPGLLDIQSVTLVFFHDQSSRIPEYIDSWKKLMINEDQTRNYPKDYKKSIVVSLLTGKNLPIFTYRLLGVFPTQTAPYSLTTTSEPLKFTQEFSVDAGEVVIVPSPAILGDVIPG